jgi:hypothetical protein
VVGKVVCIDWFSGEIRDGENEFIAVDVGKVFCGFFGGDFPDYISSPAENKTRPLSDNHIRISRA